MMRLLGPLLAELGFKDVLGTTEIVGGKEYAVVLGKAPCVWDTNRNVMVVVDERRHPWVRLGNDTPSILRLPLDDRADRGAYVPHSAGLMTQAFWRGVFPTLPARTYPDWRAALTALESHQRERDEQKAEAERRANETAGELCRFLSSDEGRVALQLLDLHLKRPGRSMHDLGLDLIVGVWESTGQHHYYLTPDGKFWKRRMGINASSQRVDARAVAQVCLDPVGAIRAGIDRIAQRVR